MVLPTKTVRRTLVSNASSYVDLDYTVQARPYTLMLPLHNRRCFAGTIRGVRIYAANSYYNMDSAANQGTYNVLTAARNRSYVKMVGRLGNASQLGSTLTSELRSTFGTITTLVVKALETAKAVRRLDLSAAARGLGLPYRERTRVVKHRVVARIVNGKPRYRTIRRRETYFDWNTGRMRVKTVANGWLMWSYGIAPLLGDLANAMEVFTRDLPFERIKGSTTLKSRRVIRTGQLPNLTLRSVDVSASVSQSVGVRVSNPNLWLANRLGLVNPVQMINEGIPFSFVADWFSNLSEVISSLTDFVGLQTSEPCSNEHVRLKETTEIYSQWEGPRAGWYDGSYSKRTLGLQIPKLTLAYERFQWQRALNAISLLIGFLPRK